MMQFSHVNLRVSQLERAVAFYEKQFGLKLCRRLEADGCKMAWLRDAATPGFFLELSEGNVVRGNNHIAFITDERDKCYLSTSANASSTGRSGNWAFILCTIWTATALRSCHKQPLRPWAAKAPRFHAE